MEDEIDNDVDQNQDEFLQMKNKTFFSLLIKYFHVQEFMRKIQKFKYLKRRLTEVHFEIIDDLASGVEVYF